MGVRKKQCFFRKKWRIFENFGDFLHFLKSVIFVGVKKVGFFSRNNESFGNANFFKGGPKKAVLGFLGFWEKWWKMGEKHGKKRCFFYVFCKKYVAGGRGGGQIQHLKRVVCWKSAFFDKKALFFRKNRVFSEKGILVKNWKRDFRGFFSLENPMTGWGVHTILRPSFGGFSVDDFFWKKVKNHENLEKTQLVFVNQGSALKKH